MARTKAAPVEVRTIRVGLYTRVSTDLQANKEEGSLDTQEARLRAAVQARASGHEVTHVFREEGESGKSLDRPALQRLLEHVRNGELDLIMVTRIDRLSRSLLDFYEMHRLFEANEVQFVSLNETFDTSSAVGRAMLKLVLVFAELEREQTAERTRLAIAARAERGLWNGGAPPLGYDSAGAGRLVVNPQEAELVRIIFTKYLELASTVKVAKWLNLHGYRQKRYESKRRGPVGGNPFHKMNVASVLTCRLYIGEIEHKGTCHPGQHPALIEREVFERARSIMECNRVHPNGAKSRAHYEYLLTGILRCSCGHGLTTSSGTGLGGTYPYYRCVGMNRKVDHVCKVRQLRADVADRAVLTVIGELVRRPRLLEEAAEKANQLCESALEPVKARLEATRGELLRVEKETMEVFRQLMQTGMGPTATGRKLLAEGEERQSQLRQTVAELEGEVRRKSGLRLEPEKLKEALGQFDQVFEALTLDEKREFMRLMIREIVVKRGELQIQLYEGEEARRVVQTSPGVRRVVTSTWKAKGKWKIRSIEELSEEEEGEVNTVSEREIVNLASQDRVIQAMKEATSRGREVHGKAEKNETPDQSLGFVLGNDWLRYHKSLQTHISVHLQQFTSLLIQFSNPLAPAVMAARTLKRSSPSPIPLSSLTSPHAARSHSLATCRLAWVYRGPPPVQTSPSPSASRAHGSLKSSLYSLLPAA